MKVKVFYNLAWSLGPCNCNCICITGDWKPTSQLSYSYTATATARATASYSHTQLFLAIHLENAGSNCGEFGTVTMALLVAGEGDPTSGIRFT